MSRRNIIKCSNCQQEYLPGEIYYPKEFLGQPKHIAKDVYGRIIGYEGQDQNLEETFRCDNCNTLFKVSCKLNFTVESLDDEDSYRTTLFHRLFMNES